MSGRPNIIKVAIVGDAKPLLAATTAAEGGLQGLGTKAASIGKALGAVLVAGAVVAGGALFHIGSDFDDAYDTIRIDTGKTGVELDGLKDSFREVVGSVPTDFDKASTAVSDLNKRLGLTGPVLADRSEQFLELSRLTKTDLSTNIASVTGLFTQFGVGAERQGEKLDLLFRASQATGVSVSDLADGMSGAGAQLRASGFDFSESTALVAGLGKAGLSVTDVQPAMTKAMALAAKEGKSSSQVWSDLVTNIQKAPNDTKAAAVAFDLLGAKAGPKFAELVRSGNFSFTGLRDTIANGSDTIIQAGKDTADFGEKWELFKNRILLKLEPIATAVFDGVSKAMDKLPAIIDRLQAKIGPLFQAFVHNKPALMGTAAVIGGVLVVAFTAWAVSAATAAAATVAAAAPVIAIAAAVVGLGAALVYAWNNSETFRNVVTSTGKAAVVVFGWLRSETADLASFFAERWGKIEHAVTNVVAAIRIQVTAFIAPFVLAWRYFHEQILAVVSYAWTQVKAVVSGAVRIISDIFDVFTSLLSGDWGGAWDAFKDIPAAAVDLVIAGLGGFVTFVVDFFSSLPGNIVSATGDLARTLAPAAADLVKGFALTLAEKWVDVQVWFLTLPARVLAAIPALTRTLAQKGIDLLTGLVSGLVSGAVAVGGWFGSLPGQVLSFVGNLNSLLWQKGIDLLTGLVSGVTQKAYELFGWFGSLPWTVLSTIGDWGHLLWDTGARVMRGLLDGMKSGWETAKGWLSSLNPATWFNDINPFKGHAVKNLVPVGLQVFAGLTSGMRKGWGRTREFLANIDPSAHVRGGSDALDWLGGDGPRPPDAGGSSGTGPRTTVNLFGRVDDSAYAAAVTRHNRRNGKAA